MATQKSLLTEQRVMSSSVYVEQASGWADALARAESRRPGDYDNALRRVGEATGVGYSTLWGLRYRKPKRVFADIYFSLCAAHEAMCRQQMEALEKQLAEAEKSGAHAHHLREAQALVANARR